MRKMETPQITSANMRACSNNLFAGLGMFGLETGTAVLCYIPMCIDIMGSGSVDAL